MPATVRLKDIVEALDMLSDDYRSFVNLDTGQVETVSLELLSEAEEPRDDDEDLDLPEWQKGEWEAAKRIVSSDRCERLPTKSDVNEWAIMEEFSDSRTGRTREELLDAIHGAGAFRFFRSTLRRLAIEPAWHAFREEALRKIAIEWCEENDVDWE